MNEELNPADEELYLLSLLQPITTRALRDEALTKVKAEDFWSASNGSIWEAARQLHDAEQKISKRSILGVIGAELASEGMVGAADRILTRLTGITPRSADFPQALAEVLRCGKLRRLVEAADRIKQRAFTAEDTGQALAWAMEELAGLDKKEETTEVKSFGDLLEEFLYEQEHPEQREVIPTPWTEVNEVIGGGLERGCMYVIGARPGEGKSISAHQMAEHAAGSGYPSIVFSLEMGGGRVTGRIVASGAQVEQSSITRRELGVHEWSQVRKYADRARSYPLFINDKSDVSVAYVKAVCRNQKRRTGLDVVVIDYLQLMTSHGRESREQQVANISRQLKIMAGELDVAVIVPAQLNRENVKANRKPVIADLRESGSIEADADVVMLHSMSVFEEGEMKGERTGMITVDFAKNRLGRPGPVELDWRPHYSTIGRPQHFDNVVPLRGTSAGA